MNPSNLLLSTEETTQLRSSCFLRMNLPELLIPCWQTAAVATSNIACLHTCLRNLKKVTKGKGEIRSHRQSGNRDV